MIKVNDTVRLKNDRQYNKWWYSKLWKVISVNDDTVVAELISDDIENFIDELDKSKIQVYIKQNDEWKIGNFNRGIFFK